MNVINSNLIGCSEKIANEAKIDKLLKCSKCDSVEYCSREYAENRFALMTLLIRLTTGVKLHSALGFAFQINFVNEKNFCLQLSTISLNLSIEELISVF